MARAHAAGKRAGDAARTHLEEVGDAESLLATEQLVRERRDRIGGQPHRKGGHDAMKLVKRDEAVAVGVQQLDGLGEVEL